MSSENKDLWQTLVEGAINHYSREAIIASLNFISELSEDDVKEWTMGMSPEQCSRVYRVWKACQIKEESSPILPNETF